MISGGLAGPIVGGAVPLSGPIVGGPIGSVGGAVAGMQQQQVTETFSLMCCEN